MSRPHPAHSALAAMALSCTTLSACATGSAAGVHGAQPPRGQGPQVLLGPLTRAQVEAAAPSWAQAGVEAKPDQAAAQALATVPPGAEVTVLLGTWCSDSRREVSRLWRALDEIGAGPEGGPGGGLPFTLSYVGVDEAKRQPAAAVAAAGLRYVPTLIVRREGREVGRIVESSPHGVEVDLLALLDGKAQGVLTASPEAATKGSAAPGSAPPHRRP